MRAMGSDERDPGSADGTRAEGRRQPPGRPGGGGRRERPSRAGEPEEQDAAGSRRRGSAARRSSARRSAPRPPATPGRGRPTSRARTRRPQERLETRHLETALKMASVARRDEGRRDEDRPDGLLHRHRLPAPRVPRDLPGRSSLSCAPTRPRCRGRRSQRCSRRSTTSRPERVFAVDRAGGVRGGLDRPGPPRDAARRHARSRSRSSTRGSPMRSSRTSPTRASSSGWRRCWRRGSTRRRSPPSCGSGCSRSSTTSTRRRTSAPSPAPTTGTRSSSSPRSTRGTRAAGCWSRDYVEGRGFEEVKAARAGRARHLRRDRLPLLLRLDLPPAALQRRHPPGQLPADGGRPGRLPRLRDDQAAHPQQIQLEQRAVDAAGRDDPEAPARARCTTSASSPTRARSTPSG